MLKAALNTNIIPHVWQLANIVPILKSNINIDKGTSYMTISVLSVIAKTLEKSLPPYITANIPYTPTQHGYKTQHSTMAALHTLNTTVAKGVQTNGSHGTNNHCNTSYEQSFRRYKLHTLIRKLLHTKIPARHNQEVHRKLHQGTQILHNIHKSHILTTSIHNWRSTRRNFLTNTILDIHCRHTTFQSTGTDQGLRR